MNEIISQKKEWNEYWKNKYKVNLFGRILHFNQKRCIKKIISSISLRKEAKILDYGCGSGRTLSWFREFGYKNSIGIDISQEALKICELQGLKIGKDVFHKNNLHLKPFSFDLVFADGVLEHYKNFEKIIKEMCKLSKQYVLITQPNHFSLFGKILALLNRHCEVHEYPYVIEDFIRYFLKYGMKPIFIKSYNFNEQVALLFKK